MDKMQISIVTTRYSRRHQKEKTAINGIFQSVQTHANIKENTTKNKNETSQNLHNQHIHV